MRRDWNWGTTLEAEDEAVGCRFRERLDDLQLMRPVSQDDSFNVSTKCFSRQTK